MALQHPQSPAHEAQPPPPLQLQPQPPSWRYHAMQQQPTYASTDKQQGLWYLLPHIWDSLWLAIPPPVRAVIASVSVPWLMFCVGTSIGGGSGGGAIASAVLGLVRWGQQAGMTAFSSMSAAQGGGGGSGAGGAGGSGGFVGGMVSAAMLWWGWKKIAGTREGG
ncbi:hypothetical protein HDU86_000519 [Geranomyces michiganensis]|nr:hypothetical protein HDU86_000519 [Geranomyces michiganensis]